MWHFTIFWDPLRRSIVGSICRCARRMASNFISGGACILHRAFISTKSLIESTEGDNDANLAAAKKLADILRAKRAYTNTATFDLRCEVSKSDRCFRCAHHGTSAGMRNRIEGRERSAGTRGTNGTCTLRRVLILLLIVISISSTIVVHRINDITSHPLSP